MKITYELLELDNGWGVAARQQKTPQDAFLRQEARTNMFWFSNRKEAEDFILIEKLAE